MTFIKVNYRKKIKGLCYVEDVLDKNGKKVAKMIFDNKCNPITEANNYLRELRITSVSSYNSLNVIARELCHFYNFLIVANISINELDKEWLAEFINYLTKIDTNKNRYSIENSLLNKIPLCDKDTNFKITQIRKFGRLKDKYIFRIFDRAIRYLQYLKESKQYKIKLDLERLKSKRVKLGFLKAKGLHISQQKIEPIANEKILTEEQIERIKEEASKRNDYQRFLYFLLEKTGIRIGEALGLIITDYDGFDVKSIKGDIYFKDGEWKVKVVWRSDNPIDSLAKGHSVRIINIADNDKYEFESLLDRYLKSRTRKLKNKTSKWLFVSNRGSKLKQNTAYKRFKNTLKNACPECIDDITLHSFRHTFCTNEIMKGVPLEIVAKIVGHKSPKTTFDLYVHYSGERMEKVREKYSHYLTNKLKGSDWR